MEHQNVRPTEPQSIVRVTQKLPYAPPQATFIPLKPEERLQKCYKTYNKCSHDIQNS